MYSRGVEELSVFAMVIHGMRCEMRGVDARTMGEKRGCMLV